MVENATSAGVDPDAVVRKCARRIVPLLLLGFLLCYLDRTNVGMAALTMNPHLGLSATMYGMGVGLFFWGYCLFSVPSNMALKKLGVRVWIPTIMVVWGLVSASLASVTTVKSYYVLRCLLGVAEAGFVPGVMFYFRSWFPKQYSGRMIGWFLLANPISSVIGNPLSGLVLRLDGLAGLRGWKWLFLLESLPTVLLGLALFFLLADSPRDAKWLAPAEKDWIERAVRRDHPEDPAFKSQSLLATLANPRIWLLSSIYLGITIGIYGVSFFLPQIVNAFGLSTTAVGLVSAVPSLFGAVAMVLWSAHSDKTGERAWHTAVGCICLLCGLVLAAYAPTPVVSILGLTLASAGSLAGMVTFWSMPNALISGKQAAVAIGLVNTIGSLGGVVGPNIMGVLRDATGDFRIGLLGLAACQIVGIAGALYFRGSMNAARRRAAAGPGGVSEPASTAL